MDAQENKVELEMSKAIDELFDEYFPNMKKSQKDDSAIIEKGKASEDDEKKEDEVKSKGKADSSDEDEQKSKGKSDDNDEDEKMEKEYKSLSLNQIVEAVKKSLAEDKVKEEMAKSQNFETKEVEVKDNEKFQKSVVKALCDLQDQMQKIAKGPARIRKSIVNGYEAVEKSESKVTVPEMTVQEISDTMLEMVKKGDLKSEVVCEFDGTEKISDPLIKSQVISAVKARKGLK